MMVDLIILLAIATVAGAITGVKNLVNMQLEKDLTATAEAMVQVYNAHEGRYRLENGKAYKGEYCISDHTEVVDEIYEASEDVATFFYGDTRMVTSIRDDSGNRVTGTKTTDPNVLQKVLKDGEPYYNEHLEISGKAYFVLYYPVHQVGSQEIIGMTFVGVPCKTVMTALANVVMQIMLFFVVIAVITLIVTVKILNSIVAAIHLAQNAAKEMAEGNLAFEISEKTTKRVDEAGDMYRSLLELRESLVDMFSSVKQQSDDLMETSVTLDKMADETARTIGHVESAVDDIANGATAQAQDASKAQGDVLQMGNLIEQTVGEIGDLRGVSNKMAESGEMALGILNELISVNETAVKAIELIAKQTDETNEAALKIREATNLITSIAEETNLLSLNASIEAARAGDAGRGFAVVADQISKLAEQSNRSGQEIEEITMALIEDSNKAVETMKEVRQIMDDQAVKMNTTNEAFGVVREGIGTSKQSVENINEMAAKLDKARKDIIDIIQNLTAVAEENAASTEETSAATSEVSAATQSVASAAVSLKKITGDLENNLSKFTF